MMRPMRFNVPTAVPVDPAATFGAVSSTEVVLNWTDGTPLLPQDVTNPAWGDPRSEVGYRIERASIAGDGTIGKYDLLASPLANVTTYSDTTALGGFFSYRVTAYNAAGNSKSAPINLEPFATVNPTALFFGAQGPGFTTLPLSILLTNTGPVDYPIATLTIAGTNFKEFAQTNTCGVSVAVGSSCTIDVTFTPSAFNVRVATLTVGNAYQTLTVSLQGTGSNMAYTLAPATLSFGNQPVDTTSLPQSITFTSTGTVAFPVTTIGTRVNDPTSFVVTHNCPASVAPLATCTITVTYKPVAAGPETATVMVNNRPLPVVTLNGTGIPAIFALAPPALSFGNQLVNTQGLQQVVLSNPGTIPVGIGSAVLSGSASFSQTGTTCGATLAEGSSCTITVAFTPPVRGPQTATLSVTGGAPISTQSVTAGRHGNRSCREHLTRTCDVRNTGDRNHQQSATPCSIQQWRRAVVDQWRFNWA